MHSQNTTVADMLLAGQGRSWVMPGLTQMNRLPGRASFGRAHSIELDGQWDFRMLPRPEAVTPQLVRTRDRKGWNSLPVPSTWTLYGHGHPHYTNIQMPFALNPPEVPADNPTGLYRREVQIPADWAGLRVHLEVGGAESVLYVYLNGHAIGMSKDSRLAAEFDLTPHLRVGETNLLTLAVVKWSDASYIEDQDQWWMGGIFRSVRLHAVPPVHIADAGVTPRLEAGFAHGHLAGSIRVSSHVGWDQPVTLKGRLLPPGGGRACARFTATMPVERHHMKRWHCEIPFQMEVEQPALWSAESPALYTLELDLHCGPWREKIRLRTGFREVKIINGQVCLNGQPLFFHGVNRHEVDPDHGRFVPAERMWEDARLLKSLNLNAVRCSHYPCDPLWYAICDEVGLYVVDEANIEAHAFHNTLNRNPDYALPWLERVQRMVIRDRNHPSILFWSLGNESGYGPHHDAAAAWVRHFDPSRLLHYEGAISRGQTGATWHDGHPATDIICPMYSSIDELEAWFSDPGRDRRPVILCEYSHAMGNSNGSLADYDALFRKYFDAGLQGGFIWEWVDHGLRHRTPDGRTFIAYGGDFGETPHDANFVCDGLVGPDRELHPACMELNFLARPLVVESVDPESGALRMRSRRRFTGTDDLRLEWRLHREGVIIAEGSIPAPNIAPSAVVNFPIPELMVAEVDQETRLDITVLARQPGLLPKGHLVSIEQVSLPGRPRPTNRLAATRPRSASLEASAPTPQLAGEPGLQVVTLGDRRWEWCAQSGLLRAMLVRGRSLIAAPIEPCFWRAAVDNDGIKLWSGQEDKPLGRWLRLGLDSLRWRLLEPLQADLRDGCVRVLTRLAGSGRGLLNDLVVELETRIQPDASWSVRFRAEVAEDLADLPRIGLLLGLAPELNRLRFHGLGPWENYSDRRAGALLAVHGKRLDEATLPYVMPQEYGHHTETRWMEASGRSLRLRVSADSVFEFNYTQHRPEALYAARHRDLMDPSTTPWLHLDIAHRGVGTGSCGPDTRPEYRVPAGVHEHTFHFES